MINLNLCNKKYYKNISSKYFAHYKTERESRNVVIFQDPFEQNFIRHYEELSKNDWELHKKYIEEGINPNEIAKIIRNDEIEKLQEISSQEKFDFNQKIRPSLYERCSFINNWDVTLIDYAAFFGSIKCFKYLLLNGSNIDTSKYAIAGGNLEIIHLCAQNHSSFEDAYETAIRFHKNDIFIYVYENNLVKLQSDFFNKIAIFCIRNENYEILSFLEEKGIIEIENDIINESALFGNIYLLKHFLQRYQIPKNILCFSVNSENLELIHYVLEQKGININAKTICLYYLKYVLII